jgi:biopolymer transport protein ExbD
VAVIITPAIPLDLPKGCGADIEALILITLTANGATLLDDRAIGSDDAFLASARGTFSAHPAVFVQINADAAVSHGRVVHVLDLVRQAGISNIALGEQRLWIPLPTE